jgi:mannose-1-phosphate guanylyltransferase
VSENEVIVVLPVDPYIEGHFFEKVKELEKALADSDADLALIGVKPTYPSSKYGYIVPIEQTDKEVEYFTVNHFTEKPSEEKAQILIERNALWNCGVFAFKFNYLIYLIY